jgi:hypothetical protein
VADESIAARVLLMEYERLKDEQKTRIGFRDSLIYATLASLAGVIAATLNDRGHAALLLLLPPVCVVLGWTYLVNDEKVSAIGRYLRADLAHALGELAPDGATIFGWETAHRRDARRRSRKLLQLGVDVATFCLPGLTAVVIFWVNGPQTVPFMTVSVAETAAVLTLAVQIVRYADLESEE